MPGLRGAPGLRSSSGEVDSGIAPRRHSKNANLPKPASDAGANRLGAAEDSALVHSESHVHSRHRTCQKRGSFTELVSNAALAAGAPVAETVNVDGQCRRAARSLHPAQGPQEKQLQRKRSNGASRDHRLFHADNFAAYPSEVQNTRSPINIDQ
eukprot:1146424-Pyramimonas_sp.AAC.1